MFQVTQPSSAYQTTSHIEMNEINYQLGAHFMKFEYEHKIQWYIQHYRSQRLSLPNT